MVVFSNNNNLHYYQLTRQTVYFINNHKQLSSSRPERINKMLWWDRESPGHKKEWELSNRSSGYCDVMQAVKDTAGYGIYINLN